MIIAALGGDPVKKELASRIFPGSVAWFWEDSIEDLIAIKSADAWFDFDFVPEKNRIAALSKLLPKPVIINSVVHTIAEIGQPFTRINAWPGFLKRPMAELSSPGRDEEEKISPIFREMNWPFQFVPDEPGMISAVIIAQVINEAYFTIQEKISTKNEIDIAMKLGTNYPHGPFEWAGIVGLENIVQLLSRLQKESPRYQPAAAMEEELNQSKLIN